MTSPSPTPPSRFRFVVLGLLCLLAMITYMDRAANGSAKKAIMADLNVDLIAAGQKPYVEDDFFIVLMAFQLAYAIFEIPSGWLGDTKGPRSTLLRVVLWWSLFVALTGFTGMTLPGGFYIGFGALVVIQFLFGVGEAGAFPNIAKSLYNWFPANDRGFAKSAVWMAARLMGGLTPLLWVLINSPQFMGLTWRTAMWIFASAAFIWSIAFYFIFKNKPDEHPSVNAGELALINEGRNEKSKVVRIPWGRLLKSRNLWAVCGMYIVTNFCWYFLMYNLPGRLRAAYGSWSDTKTGEIMLNLLAGAPLLVGMFGCLLGGILSDRTIKRTGNRKWGRRWVGMLGYGGAGVCYLIAAWVNSSMPGQLLPFAVMLIAMGFFNDLIMAPAWAVCQDIGQDYAATVSGAMNMAGNLLGAVLGIFFTGMVMKYDAISETNRITICFVAYALVYFIGVGLWMLIDAGKPIELETKE
ncbi:MAG: MFS transporter [Gemmataceae bacterium]